MAARLMTVAALGIALLFCPRTFAQTQQDEPPQQPVQESAPQNGNVQQDDPVQQNMQNDEKVAFPSPGQITAVLDQGDNAAQEYQDAIDLAEKRESGNENAFAKDRQAISDWKALSKSLRADPLPADSAKYDGESGFKVVVTLNEASRTASLAALELLTQASILTREWNFGAVNSRRRLAQNFQHAAGQLHASSESATQLFHSYLAAKDALTLHMANTLNRAANALTVCKAAASK
jgi:hypothetical protein